MASKGASLGTPLLPSPTMTSTLENPKSFNLLLVFSAKISILSIAITCRQKKKEKESKKEKKINKINF